jgi:NAD(P)-dependent dehydrogenase (short-subunit alcohol dehydrogenase family)
LFAAEGGLVVVSDFDTEKGEQTVDQIREKGREASFVKADVTDPDQTSAMAVATIERYGGLDILFANAGVPGPDGPLTENTLEDLRLTVDVNLMGVMNSCRAAIPELIVRGGGSIIMTSSTAGVMGSANLGVYSATKGAVVSLTQGLAKELGPKNIRVNSVAPGPTVTPMWTETQGFDETRKLFNMVTPLGRMCEAKDIANAVAFLASEEASMITGVTLTVDGGFTLNHAVGVVGSLLFAGDDH